MKVTKNYSLSEKTLEKDIDKSIRDAKKGAYQYDYKYGQEGLKLNLSALHLRACTEIQFWNKEKVESV